jgi:putative Holliday junction resolvase
LRQRHLRLAAGRPRGNVRVSEAIDTLLGFDFGVKRIGVAVGNTLIRQAQPLKVIAVIDNAARFAQIGELIEQWRPARVIVGLPRHPDGAEHEMTARCRRFANQLHGRFNLPVELVDERYSSAVIAAKRGEIIDDRAASIILQQFFDDYAQSN